MSRSKPFPRCRTGIAGLLLSCSVVLGAFACGDGRGSAGAAESASSTAVRWLFTLSARGASLVAGPEPDAFTLELERVDASVLAFADRPERKVDVVPTAEFVDRWQELFPGSPPNAALVQHDAAGDADSVVVELSEPSLNDDRLTFRARVLAGDDGGSTLRLTRGRLYDSPPATFGPASLFIDPGQFPAWCTYDQEHGTSADPDCGCPITFADGKTFYMPC